jgi:hypothetical protein
LVEIRASAIAVDTQGAEGLRRKSGGIAGIYGEPIAAASFPKLNKLL